MVVDKKHEWMSLTELEKYIKAHPEFHDNDHKKWKGARWKDDEWVKQRDDESTLDVQMRLFGHPLEELPPQRRALPKQQLARSIPSAPIKSLKLASSVDLRGWCTGIADQGTSPECGAYATVAGFEWLQNNRTGHFVDGSERFVASNLGIPPMGTDANLYETVTVGVPPKSMWDWNGGNPSISWENDEKITAPEEVYTKAAQYKTTQAQLIWDGIDTTISGNTVLNIIKTALTTYNAPLYVRLLIYPNTMSGSNGVMLCPTGLWMGGAGYGAHSMLCVGYSDAAGYLIFQNSWGASVGDNGYYYMPYEFVTVLNMDRVYTRVWNVWGFWTIYGESVTDGPNAPTPNVPVDPNAPSPNDPDYPGSPGSDKIRIPAGGEINNLKNFTMEFIFYHGGYGGINKGRLWDKGVFHVYVDTYGPAINRLYIERNTSSGETEGWATPQGSLNAGEWYYVQLTWDVDSAGIHAPMIYINNVLQVLTHTSYAKGVWADDSPYDAIIGNNEAGDRWLNAKLSMFKLHRTSISEWQLSEEYYKNMWRCDPAKDTCQVEFTKWPSSGTTIINTSGTGATYNGTATNEDYDTLPSGSNIWKLRGD